VQLFAAGGARQKPWHGRDIKAQAKFIAALFEVAA
jgi:hypothetical protein